MSAIDRMDDHQPLPACTPTGLTRAAFLAAVARGAATELDAPLSSGHDAVACATDYLEHCWALVPQLDSLAVEELKETAAMIAADLWRQQRLRSA